MEDKKDTKKEGVDGEGEEKAAAAEGEDQPKEENEEGSSGLEETKVDVEQTPVEPEKVEGASGWWFTRFFARKEEKIKVRKKLSVHGFVSKAACRRFPAFKSFSCQRKLRELRLRLYLEETMAFVANRFGAKSSFALS